MKDLVIELIKRTLEKYPDSLWEEGVDFSAVALTRGQELKDEYSKLKKTFLPHTILSQKMEKLEKIVKSNFETVPDPAFNTNFFIKWES